MRPLIYGLKVIVLTDHQPLKYVFLKNIDDPQISRWALICQNVDLKISYIKGDDNASDLLSRIENIDDSDKMLDIEAQESQLDFCGVLNTDMPVENIDLLSEKNLLSEQSKDPVISAIVNYLQEGMGKPPVKDIINYILIGKLLYFKNRTMRFGKKQVGFAVVLPKNVETSTIRSVHESPLLCHLAFDKTLEKFRSYYHIIELEAQKVAKICKSCHKCISFSARKQKKSLVGQYPIPDKPFEIISCDFLGPFRETEKGNRYLLVFIDFLTRFTILYPLPNRKIENVISATRTLIKTYDCPRKLISDNAPEFKGELMQNLAKSHGFVKLEVAPYHPESNGLCERSNQKVLKALRMLCAEVPEQWDQYTADAMAAVNGSLNTSLGETPFFALYKFDKKDIYTTEIEETTPFYNYDDFFDVTQRLAKKVYEEVKQNLQATMSKYIQKTNRNKSANKLEEGQRVYVKNIPKVGENSKLALKWKGPAVIMQKLSQHKYKIQLLSSGKCQIAHQDNLFSRNEIRQLDENEYIVEHKKPKKQKCTNANSHRMLTRNKILQDL